MLMTKNDWPVLDRWFPNRGAWSRSRYGAWLLGIYLLLGGAPYILINRFAAWRDVSTVDVRIPVDEALPYVPAMVVPYYSLYLYYPIAVWVAARQPVRHDGLLFFQRMLVVTWITFAMYLLFPVEIDLRDQAVGAEGVFGALMDGMHQADEPWNAWPSIHVLQSLLIVLFVRWARKKDGTWSAPLAAAVWTACGLLVASTVLIKQHFLFDVVSAITLVAVMWRWYILPGLNRTAN